MPVRMIWLSLSVICLISGSTESTHLRTLQEMPENAAVCLSLEECSEAFLSMNTGGDFFTGDFPDKGCFTKYEHGYYGTGGTDDEIAAIDLPGARERIWCERETASPTSTPSKLPTEYPTLIPATEVPTYTPSNELTTNPTLMPVTESPSKEPTENSVTDGPSYHPSHKPTADPMPRPTTQIPTSSPSSTRPSLRPSSPPISPSPTLTITFDSSSSPSKKPTSTIESQDDFQRDVDINA